MSFRYPAFGESCFVQEASVYPDMMNVNALFSTTGIKIAMSPELETLDQLQGDELSLAIIANLLPFPGGLRIRCFRTVVLRRRYSYDA